MTQWFVLILGGVLRALLATLTGALVTHHILSAADGDAFSKDVLAHLVLWAPLLVAIGWSAIQKYASRVQFLTALDSPQGTTEARVKASIAEGFGASLKAGAPLVLLALCLGLATMPACSTGGMPPPGTYDAAGTHAFQADQLLKDIRAAGQTARNLNAVSGAEHLSDRDTAYVRDFSLIAGAGLNAWGSGATTLNAARASIDVANLPAGLATTLRTAFDQAVIDHGASASTLTIVTDVYKVLRANISISASKNPKLTAILGAIDAGIASIPAQ